MGSKVAFELHAVERDAIRGERQLPAATACGEVPRLGRKALVDGTLDVATGVHHGRALPVLAAGPGQCVSPDQAAQPPEFFRADVPAALVGCPTRPHFRQPATKS